MNDEWDEQQAAAQAEQDRREQAALLGKVRLQFDAEDFLRSDVGRFLMARSEETQQAALMALADCDPTDVETIRKSQFDYRVASSWMDWIAEAIVEGQAAQQQLVNSAG